MREIVEAARAAGRLRDAPETPKPGWLGIFGRVVGGRLRSPLRGEGHVTVYAGDGVFVGGNQPPGPGRVSEVKRSDVLAWAEIG